MKSVTALALVAYTAVSLAVGWRGLSVFRETRRLPELFLAVAMIMLGLLGFAVEHMVRVLTDAETESPTLAFFFAVLPDYVGSAALTAFACVAYPIERPVIRMGVAAVVVALLFVGAFMEVWSGSFLHYLDGKPDTEGWIAPGLAARAVPGAWVSALSLHHYGILRRRARVGLADPAVVNRVLLWGIASAGAAVGNLVAMVARFTTGRGIDGPPWAMSAAVVFAISSSATLYLAFFSPDWYRRWIRRGYTPEPE